MIPRFRSLLWIVLVILGGYVMLGGSEAKAQIIETTPSPPRIDEPVTIYFNADRGSGGLAGYDSTVYAHTGISTSSSPPPAWKCVKIQWENNRPDTRMERVGPDRYKLEIQSIRDYYMDTSTQCNFQPGEKIRTLNFVFRSADGSLEGKAEGGGDLTVNVRYPDNSEDLSDRLKDDYSTITNTRRVMSNAIRDAPIVQYGGYDAGVVARYESNTNTNQVKWSLSVFGYANSATGMGSANGATLTADGATLAPVLVSARSQAMGEDVLEVVRIELNTSAYQTLAQSEAASVQIGGAQFDIPSAAKRDMREIMDAFGTQLN